VDEIALEIPSNDKFDEIDAIRCTMTLHPLSPRHEALLRQVLAAGEPVAPGALEQAL
jgi:hypothetical protein